MWYNTFEVLGQLWHQWIDATFRIIVSFPYLHPWDVISASPRASFNKLDLPSAPMNRCSSNFQSINFVCLTRQQGRCRLLTTAAPSAYGYSIMECPESAFAQYFFQWPLSMLATSRVGEEGSKTWHSSATRTPMCKESISRAVTNHNLPRQKQSCR